MVDESSLILLSSLETITSIFELSLISFLFIFCPSSPSFVLHINQIYDVRRLINGHKNIKLRMQLARTRVSDCCLPSFLSAILECAPTNYNSHGMSEDYKLRSKVGVPTCHLFRRNTVRQKGKEGKKKIKRTNRKKEQNCQVRQNGEVK